MFKKLLKKAHQLNRKAFSSGIGKLTKEEYQSLVNGGHFHTLTMAFPDSYGRLMGKRFDLDTFKYKDLIKEGGHACNYLLACDLNCETPEEIANWSSGYGDYHLLPDELSLRKMWMDKHLVILCDLETDMHKKVPHAPRTLLKNQVERAANMGFTIQCATELEYYTFMKSAKTNFDEGYKDLQLAHMYPEDYNILMNDRNERMVEEIRRTLKNSGIKVETSKGEAGPSQHEVNIKYSDPISMADDHVFFKQIIKHVADNHNKSVTFMAKPFAEHCGSSCHIHMSIYDKNGINQFKGDDVLIDERLNLKASKRLLHFLGGWMNNVLDVFPFYAPYVNSYKRYVTSSWAPTNLNSWSVDNRTSPFRIVGRGQSLRIEFRIPGADANPYLALAASLASGLDGIEKSLEPPEIFKGNAYDLNNEKLKRAPKSLEAAIEIFKKSEKSADFFGKEVRDHYYNMYRIESNLYNKVVTDWERRRYFDHA